MSADQRSIEDIPLGLAVLIPGTVIGRSEFQKGPPSYLVEFERGGKIHREWFIAADLETGK